MSWPAGMPLIPVTQDTYLMPDGSLPTTYVVHLTLSVPALVLDGVSTVIRRTIVLDGTGGVIADEVPHLNHPSLSPTPVYYMVREYANGALVRQPWQLTPAADATTLDLDALAPIAGDPGTPVAVGPPGPTAVSADAGNIAVLGTDDLLFVPAVPTEDIEGAVIDYLLANPPAAAVDSVNGQIGAVVLGAADVGADPAGTAAGLVGALVIPDSPDDIGAASAAHSHAPEDITGTAVITTDARLSDARPPLAHAHTLADVTDAGDAAGLDVGTTAGTVMAGDDSRVTSLSSTYAPAVAGLYATERRTYADRLLDLRRTAKVYNTIESFADVTGWSAGAAETIDGFTTLSIPTPWETIKDYNAPFAITATQINVVVRFHVVNVDRLSSLRLYFYDASGSNGYGGVLSAPPGGWVEGWNVGTTKRTTFSTIGVAPGWDALEQMRFKVYPVTSPSYPTVNVAEVSPYEMQPMCSIWFDDGHETVVTKAFPIMDAKGFTGSLTVQGQMDYYPGAHMTAQQHRDLAQAGWDLSNHTWSHPDLSVLDEAGNEAEISRGLDIALKLGGGAAAYHFVPPMGRTNAYTLAAASKYATVMRRNAGANIMPVADFMALTSVEPAVGELATTTISVINGAITAQTWLILLFHSIGDGDPTLSRNVGGFQAIIDHLDAHRAEITTLPPTLAIASM